MRLNFSDDPDWGHTSEDDFKMDETLDFLMKDISNSFANEAADYEVCKIPEDNCFERGQIYLKRELLFKARKEFSRGADEYGCPLCAFMMGIFIVEHLGEKNSSGTTEYWSMDAEKYFKVAVDAKNPDAAYIYALCLKEGKGMQQDCKKAAKYMIIAADLGHADAQSYLKKFVNKESEVGRTEPKGPLTQSHQGHDIVTPESKPKLKRGDVYVIDGVEGIVLEYDEHTGEGKMVSKMRVVNSWEDPSFGGIFKKIQAKTSPTPIGSVFDDGRVCCREIRKTKNWDWKYPCVWWCVEGLGKGLGHWYLPAYREFDKNFFSNEVQTHYKKDDEQSVKYPAYWTANTHASNKDEAFVIMQNGGGYAADRKSRYFLVAMRYFKI